MMINIILHTFFRNFNPSVKNNGLIKSTILNDIYVSNKEKNKIHVYSVLK